MAVEAFVDAWRDGWPGLNRGQVEGGFESFAGDVGTGVGAGDFLFGFEGAGFVTGLGEEGAGELGELWGEGGVVGWDEGEEGLFDGAVHCGDAAPMSRG